MQQIDTTKKVKLNLARLKKAGQNFEVNVDPELALKFRKGEIVEVRDVLKAEQVFTDAKKGELAPKSKLEEAFQATDPLQIAKIIIKQGELQLTSEQRNEQIEQKKRKIIDLIHRNAIDPATKLPHPLQRIELAFQEARIQVDEHRPPEEQIEPILKELRPILPLKFEQAAFQLRIPPAYAAKSYSLVQKYTKIIKEDWNPDGSWSATVELPAGLKLEFLDKLNSLTHGDIEVKEKSD